MKRYIIRPNALIGHCFFEGIPNSEAVHCSHIRDNPIVFFESKKSEEYDCLSYSFFHIFSKRARGIIENSNLTGCTFKLFKKVIRGYLCDNNEISTGLEFYDDTNWTLLCVDSSPVPNMDFFQWKTNLVVSERALKILKEHKIFEEKVEGHILGKEFEIVTNCFPVEGEIEHFMRIEMPKYMRHITNMRLKIMDEYKKKGGVKG